MNYEEMSDFEINKAVAEALGIDVSGQKKNGPSGAVFICDKQRHVDYCNVPNDAFPIITRNKMEMWAECHQAENEKSESGWKLTGRFFDKDKKFQCIRYFDKNPLRAAMIVFLKMNE